MGKRGRLLIVEQCPWGPISHDSSKKALSQALKQSHGLRHNKASVFSGWSDFFFPLHLHSPFDTQIFGYLNYFHESEERTKGIFLWGGDCNGSGKPNNRLSQQAN